MFSSIFLFELKYRFKRPATYIYFGILFLVSFLLIGTGSSPASEKVYHNSPIVIANLQLIISLFGIFIASAVMGVPIYRDVEHKTASFLFSYPITKTAYFMGRFWGSFLTLIFISFGSVVGIYLGSVLGPAFGMEEASRYGPNLLINHLHPWLSLTVPNLWLAGTLFFAVIIFTRNIKAIYSGGLIVFITYLVANLLAEDISNKDLVQILDPFSINSFNIQTRYLTPFEQNSFLLEVTGNLLVNRILWACVGLLFFVASYSYFSFSRFFDVKKVRKAKGKIDTAIESIKARAVAVSFAGSYQWRSFKTMSRIEIQNVLRDVYFRAILLGGVIFLILDFWIGSTTYGVSSMPATSVLLEYKGFDYVLFVYIILVFFTGESLHRDKLSGYSKINDTFPVKDNTVLASKFFGMVFICLVLTVLPIFIGLLVQTLKGYFVYQLDYYLIDSFLISLPDYVQMVMLVFAVHMVVNNKFAGHAVSIGIWLLLLILTNFAGYGFNLFLYSYKPNFLWSEMNDLGHFGKPLMWFNLYWLAFGLFMVLFFSIFYNRGTESGFKKRLKDARSKLGGLNARMAYGFLILSLAIGGFIFKNVVYLNPYTTGDEATEAGAEYEKQLKQYEMLPQPKMTSVNLKAELYPYKRDAYFDAEIVMVNKTDQPIDSLHLSNNGLTDFEVLYKSEKLAFRYPLKLKPRKFQVFGKTPRNGGYRIYALPNTLEPGDSITMQVKGEIVNTGFPNSGTGRQIVYNGSFIAGGIPSIGYDANNELNSDSDRREYELPAKDYALPEHDDPYGKSNLLFTNDADFIQFEATIGTVPEQIAIAPGYLRKEWTEGDRRYFHYVQDTPIQAFFNIVSADYEVFKDEQALPNGENVAIEIFYQPGHDRNLDRFNAAYKDGLKYFSETYGSFQFKQMRLLEFPRYANFAQSFPNTVPYSEGFGWLAEFGDPNEFDYGYFVTAHELAHQWWGHQITPNYTRGANLISEALAEYSALVLTERKYGTDNMKRFLKDELDSYLSGRSNESKKENTFINCNRAYQWYNKGSLILYALRDYIGKEAMNAAIRSFRDEFALKQTPPFPGSSDLYRHLNNHTPDSLKYYLEDTWKKITLYENKVNEVTAEKTGEEEYLVTIDLSSQKLYADSLGMESKAVYTGDYIDVAVFAEDDRDDNGRTRTNPLYLEKHRLAPGQTKLTVKVRGIPAKAGIDPYNKLIDRIPDDNVKEVDLE